MSEARPDPDALLASVQAEERQSGRGALRIFFGYAAGVGKTYAMLEAARNAAAQGREVVVGYLEPHARPETQALLTGLATLPVRECEHRGIHLREFDIDAALQRRPEVLLVDELAHTNAPGSRHEKRWQDVEELLNAGISVWTTLNVQHIESLNDVIGQITGVVVRETIPDRIFESAQQLELIDVTPEELLARLEKGKVYVPEQAQRAIQSFFQKANLAALRELSLRQAARRIHYDVESARRSRSSGKVWSTVDSILVCVGPSPTTARVIRTARRMASALDAPWMAVSVDQTGDAGSPAAKQQIAGHFRLAEQLGAETVTLAGPSVTDTILDFARSRNVSKILIGKTSQPRWRRLLFGSIVDELLEQSGDIDVYVIRGEPDNADLPLSVRRSVPRDTLSYLVAILLVALTGLLASGLRSLHLADSEANTVMLFLATVAGIAFRHGHGPASLASLLSVLVFDFLFVPPYRTFAVDDAQYVVTFAVMLTIGLAISTLASRSRSLVESTRRRELRTAMLYELGRQLTSIYGETFLVRAAGRKLGEMFGAEVAIYLDRPGETPEAAFGDQTSIHAHPVTGPAAQWVIAHDQLAGAGTNTLPNAVALFLPIIGTQRTHGVIAIRSDDQERLLDPDQRRLLEACANQLALALERDRLAVDAAEARIQAEAEQVRSSLLSSVSHDLKTPLAAIAGASSSLLEAESLDEATRRQLLETIVDETARLNRLLENLLQMSKLDAGAAEPSLQWHVLEELIGSALHRTQRELTRHQVAVRLPQELPLIWVDGLLVEQLFMNLLENAARHTPAGTNIEVTAAIDNGFLRIAVADNGPGLPAGAEHRVFEKFFRARAGSDGGRGSGLGLAICRAIARAHGGDISAANRPQGGAEFVIRMPLMKDSPRIEIE